MKKIISLLTVIAVVCCFGCSAFAAVDTSTTNVLTADEETGLYTVSLSDLTSQYATVLAVKGTTIGVGSIQYINQTDVSDGAATFSFALNEDRMTAETDTDDVYVLVGGGASSSTYGVIKGEEDAPETFTISGTVSGFVGSTLPTVQILNGEDVVATAVVESTGAFTVDVPTLAEGSYTLKATKNGHLSYSESSITATATINPVVNPGDVNASGQADVGDIGMIINVFNSKTGDVDYSTNTDINESGQADVGDIGIVINNFNSKKIEK